MLLVKETFKNSENKFRITNSITETTHGRMHYGNMYPAHIHDSFMEIEIISKGHMSQIINGKEYEMPAGSVAILKPADCHSLVWSEDADFITVGFEPDIISKELLYSILKYEDNIVYQFSDEEMYTITNYAAQLLNEHESSHLFYKNIVKNLIENVCFFTLRNVNPVVLKEKYLSPARNAIMYLETTFMNNPTLNEVAKYVYLNPSYFSRVFREETGVTYSKYLIELKLRYAKNLLCETNMTITDICFNSGFGSLSNFSKYFKSKYGISANEMRKRYGRIKLEFYN